MSSNKVTSVYNEIDTVRLQSFCTGCGTFQFLLRRLNLCGHMICDMCLKKTTRRECPICKVSYKNGYPPIDNTLTTLLTRISSLSKINVIEANSDHICGGTQIIPLFASSQGVEKRDAKGETNLHKECRRGHLDAVQSLLLSGIDVNTQDFAGWTSLHEAVLAQHTEIAKALLDFGAFVNVPGPNYVTPLHAAVQKQNVDLVKLLVEYGADLLCFDSDGKTPMELYCNDDVTAAMCLSERRPHIYRIYTIPSPKVFCINISSNDYERLKKFPGITLATENNLLKRGDTSYVVVRCDKPDLYLLQAAMLQGACIVTASWISDVIDTNFVHYPLDYLAKVPGFAIEKAVMNKFNKLPRLFDGLHFYFIHRNNQKIGGYLYTITDLKTLVLLGDGKVLTRLPTQHSERNLYYPYHALKTSNLAATTYYIIYDEQKEETLKKINNTLEMKHKSTRWLIECINNFTIVP